MQKKHKPKKLNLKVIRNQSEFRYYSVFLVLSEEDIDPTPKLVEEIVGSNQPVGEAKEEVKKENEIKRVYTEEEAAAIERVSG